MKKLKCLVLGVLSVSLLMGQSKVGTSVSDFTIQSVQGQPATFSSLRGDVTVLTFVSTKCPISNDYNERMKSVYSDYTSKGVKFVFVNPNVNEPAAEVASHAQTNGFPFPVYKDEGNVVADQFGASYTPEVYIIKGGSVVYHGHIDDSRKGDNIQVKGLRLALDDVLSGRSVNLPATKAFGCTIKRAKKD
jgi:peroxiredoxin